MKKYVDNFMQYRFLLSELVKKGIKLKYRRSYLGMICLLYTSEYISSAGLRVILKMQKFMNVKGTMKLIHVSDIIPVSYTHLDVYKRQYGSRKNDNL